MANAPSKRNSVFHTYRMAPLIATGLVALALLLLLGLLMWSLVAYYTHSPVSAAEPWPALIYLGALFLTSVLITLLVRGGTVFPSAALSLIVAVATLLLAEPESVTIGPALLKALLSLFAGVLGFTLAKLWVRRDAIRRAARAAAKPRPPLPEPAATKLTPAPQPEDYGMQEKTY